MQKKMQRVLLNFLSDTQTSPIHPSPPQFEEF